MYIQCPVCHLNIKVNKSGAVRKHRYFGISECVFSGEKYDTQLPETVLTTSDGTEIRVGQRVIGEKVLYSEGEPFVVVGDVLEFVTLTQNALVKQVIYVVAVPVGGTDEILLVPDTCNLF